MEYDNINEYTVAVNGIKLKYAFPGDCGDEPRVCAYVDYAANRIRVLYEERADAGDRGVEYYLKSAFFLRPNRKYRTVLAAESWDGDNGIYDWLDIWDSDAEEYLDSFRASVPDGAWRAIGVYEHSGAVFFEVGCGPQCQWDTVNNIGVWVAHSGTISWIRANLQKFRMIEVTDTGYNSTCSVYSRGQKVFSAERTSLSDAAGDCLAALPELQRQYDELDIVYGTDEEVYRAYTQREFTADLEVISDNSTLNDINEVVFDMSGELINEPEGFDFVPHYIPSDYLMFLLADAQISGWKRKGGRESTLEVWGDADALQSLILRNTITYTKGYND